MADELAQLVADLEAEQQVVRNVLAVLSDEAYDRPSPAEGWTLRDCVAHLAETDERAAAIAEGLTPGQTGARAPSRRRPAEGGVLTPGQLWAREQTPTQVFAWWQDAGDRLIVALKGLKGGERLLWAGRAMGVLSFSTARLMEHWSHGLDILEAAGVPPVDTERLHHIAHLGYMTRDFSYRNRGLEPPRSPLYLELVAPSGAVWSWGPADAPDRIRGPAGDFCRIVTQRIHLSDTSLHTEGQRALEFLAIAQAFAGPPGDGRRPRGVSRRGG